MEYGPPIGFTLNASGVLVGAYSTNFPVGTLAAPSITLGAISDAAGFYKINDGGGATARLRIGVNGTASQSWGPSFSEIFGNVYVSTGTLGVPHLSSADETCGVFLEGGSVMSLVTGAARAIAVSRVAAAQRTALYGGTPVVIGPVGATLTNNVTVGGTTNVLADFSDLTIFANSAAAIRNNQYQTGLKLATIEAKLKLLEAITT